jgi:hypothetical protein
VREAHGIGRDRIRGRSDETRTAQLPLVRSPVLAAVGTDGVKVTSCHPEPLSPVKVAEASSVPVLVHRFPTCVPVLPLDL